MEDEVTPMAEARIWSIYTLSDPRTPTDVRYVGVTHEDPRKRLVRHVSLARKGGRQYHSVKWMATLVRDGVEPFLRVIETGEGIGWEEAERRWIAWHKAAGFSLTNHAEGGRGPVGCSRSLETREKIARANRGKKQSPDLVERRVAPLRGRKLTQVAKDKVSAGNTGKRRSAGIRGAMSEARADPAWREKVSCANRETYARRKEAGLVKTTKGRKASDETREKLREAHRGKVQSEETRARRSASMKAAWARRRAEDGS